MDVSANHSGGDTEEYRSQSNGNQQSQNANQPLLNTELHTRHSPTYYNSLSKRQRNSYYHSDYTVHEGNV